MRCLVFANLVYSILATGSWLPKDKQATNASKPLKEMIDKLALGSLNTQIADELPRLLQAKLGELKSKSSSAVACLASLTTMSQLEMIALLDASGKPGAGVFSGNTRAYGSYQQCMSYEKAHYCLMQNLVLVYQPLNLTLPLTYGVCIPSACSGDDATFLFKNVFSKYLKINGTPIIHVYDNKLFGKEVFCSPEDHASHNAGSIVLICVSGLILLLCLIGTLAEMITKCKTESKSQDAFDYSNMKNENDLPGLQKVNDAPKSNDANEKMVSLYNVDVNRQQHPLLNFVMCFSLIKNTKALFSTNVPAGAITSINGIRTISMTWVILGHTYMFFFQNEDNVVKNFNDATRLSSQAILSGELSVDSFFFLSGLLVSYLSMKRFEKDGKLPLLRYYLHRYIRLTPLYLYVILVSMYLFPLFSSGPIFDMNAMGIAKQCKKYWWTNILYINNFYPKSFGAQCIGWSWYMANDMQFYVIGPLILYLMYRFKMLGTILVNGLLILVHLIVTAVLMVKYKMISNFPLHDGIMGLAELSNNKYQDYVYGKPYTRVAPYAVGIILGYLLTYKKKIVGHTRYVIYICGWLMAISVGMALVYGPHTMLDHNWSTAENATYGTLSRFAWSLCLAWLVYACHNGYGSLINDVLSWKAFIPLSRLTYATYMVHILVLMYYLGSSQVPMHYTDSTVAFHFMGITCMSYAVAYILAVCIEFPVFNLEKLFLKF